MNIEALFARVGENLSVSRAFGAPYERDGALIIPVALVAGGGGGGGDAQDNAGGGIGGAVIPAGTYVVHGDRVRWVPAVNANLVIVCALVALRLVLRHRRRTRR